MREVRASSVEEYARWYLQRNQRKHSSAIVDSSDDPVELMKTDHEGKMRRWFSNTTQWHIVSLDSIGDLANLVFLECDRTKREALVIADGKNYRLLRRVAENAIAGNYLQRPCPSARRDKYYYDRLAAGSLRLEDDNRVAICSAEETEIRSNPDAQYYLLDGASRCLAYMILVTECHQDFVPIEAFRALR